MLTVDTDTQLRGRLIAAGRVVVNLWFDGDIACSNLVIGPNGYLTGSAAAREIIIEGQVTGPIHASSVILKGGCIVEGDIHHTTITIEPGATMTGRAARFPAIQLPAELLQLEAKAEADRAALEDAELNSFEPDPVPERVLTPVAKPFDMGQSSPGVKPLAGANTGSKILPLRRNT
ncbi:MAG: polymer-forming cytoskeletal protein [Hyphomicrobium sp.]